MSVKNLITSFSLALFGICVFASSAVAQNTYCDMTPEEYAEWSLIFWEANPDFVGPPPCPPFIPDLGEHVREQFERIAELIEQEAEFHGPPAPPSSGR